uniref:LIC12162 family transferase n=1 Tax=Campylobacter hyointestinalis TaxID=198 RepID=UPI003AF6CFF3
MIHLATTALDEFWDKKADKIIFLGEWCKTNSDIKYLKAYETMPFLWSNEQVVKAAFKECWNIYDEIMPILSNYLNNVHGIDKSSRYWKIIIGNWLWSFIQIVYDRYRCIEEFIKAYSKFDTFVLHKDNYITPVEYKDFIANISSDAYNLQLYSQIFEYLGYKFRTKRYEIGQAYTYSQQNSKIREISYRLLNIFFAKKPSVVISNGYFSNKFSTLNLAFKSKGKIFFDHFYDSFSVSVDKNVALREELSEYYDGDNKFIKLLFALFEQNFPLLFLEGFSDMRKVALNKKSTKAKVYVTANYLYYNYLYKFFIAEHIDKISLVGIQHGGSYGVDNFCNAEMYERDILDYFITFGWEDNYHTKACTDEKLNQKIKSKKNGYILFVMNDMLKYLYRMDLFYQSSAIKLAYLPKTLSFFNSIGSIDRFLVRTYPVDSGFKIKQTIRNTFPNIKLDDHSKTFHCRLKNARLFVSDHMNTTYLETLAMNFPTVIFIDKNYYSFRKPEIIQLLIDAKILFYDEIEAAHHINSIYDNIDDWWLSDEVQKARREFCYHYARTSEDWAREYIKVFNNILEKNARN